MTYREQLLARITGQPTTGLPWAPRMDLWYLAQRARGTLPAEFADMNMVELAQALDVACHAVRADYTLPRPPADLALRGLGVDNHPDYPFRVELRDLPLTCTDDGVDARVTIETAAGPLIMHRQYTPELQREGVSMPVIRRYAIESVGDLAAVAEVFDHLQVIPQPAAYRRFQARLGEQGLAVASSLSAASPMHLILHDLTALDRFIYLYHDERAAVDRLAERLAPFFEAVLAAVLACDAEVVLWGANYDQNVTWPGFFTEHIAPWLGRVAADCHRLGKYLLTHTDGENRLLLEHYPSCGFDVAESVCPAPMTQCTLAEVLAGVGPQCTVWGGIPSIALLPGCMNTAAFEACIDGALQLHQSGARLILGVSDNVPPDADLGRLHAITERIRAAG